MDNTLLEDIDGWKRIKPEETYGELEAQAVGKGWYLPEFGSDSLEMALSQSYKAGERAERKRLFKEFIDIPRYVFNHKKYIKKEDVFPIFEPLSPKENE